MSKKFAPFRLNPVTRAARALIVLAGLASPGLALADDPPPGLEFSQSPPMSSSTSGVVPNVILSIDDSGSMYLIEDAKDKSGASKKRIEVLKAALQDTFGNGASNPYLKKFRLGFQAYWNNFGFGPNRFFVPAVSGHPIDNSLRLFDSDQQSNFMTWVNTLTGLGVDQNGQPRTTLGTLPTDTFYSTPSQLAMIYAGEYFGGRWLTSNNKFSSTNVTRLDFMDLPPKENTWNQKPGVEADSSPLTCRRAYHILLSDGMWNGASTPASSGGSLTIPMPYVSEVATGAHANFDGTSNVLPDGTAFNPSDTPIYSDKVPCGGGACPPKSSDKSSSTLADFSLYYWSKNLSKSSTFGVVPIMKFAEETITSGTKSAVYDKYWNPKNDPAKWQHMQTYTIGYGTQSGSATDPGAGEINENGVLPKFDKFFDGEFYNKFASGAVSWPDAHGALDSTTHMYGTVGNLYDLVHAAYNGRGKFYTATNQTALQDAFKDILNAALNQSLLPGLGSAAGSNSQLSSGSMVYVTSYSYSSDGIDDGDGDDSSINKLGGWKGKIGGYAGDNLGAPPIWEAKVPDGAAPRNIFTADASGKGIAFTSFNLATDPSGITSTTIDTVREIKPFFGDTVNSQLVYVGKPTLLSLDANYIKFSQTVNTFEGSPPDQYRQGVVYVGANDGMLHGFNAGNGSPGIPGSGDELFAYVPRGLLKNLEDTTFGPDYQHRYWVDSGMFSGDAQLDSSSYGIGTSPTNNPGHWATVLAGTLGAGGKGYFVLDVTNPDNIQESPPDALPKAVLIDATDPDTTLAGQSAYIGHQFSPPVLDMYNLTFQSSQIVRINTDQGEGEWAVIMGNGYNNASGVPVLLIQSLSQPGRPLYTVAAKCAPAGADCKAAGNGLSAPRPVDVDGNGTADFVYAGDLMGNLWKFDISNVTDRSNWGVAYKGEPMFTAVGPTGKAQPITSAPVVVPNKKGGFMVGFGTGKNLTQEDTTDAPDPANAPRNSFYALYDVEKMSVEQIEIKAASGSVPAVKASQVNLDETTLSMPCKATTGTARYASCLYERKDGVLSTTVGIVSHGKTDNTDLTGKIDGTTKLGWYYDIPETDNGNAAKVLANPMMMSDTMVLFLSDNVASSNSSAGESNDTEACDTVTVSNGTQTTINFFDLFTGARPPDNSITVTIGGVTITTDNRIRIKGPVKFVRDGTDGLVIMGLPGKNGVHYEANDSAGRRAGWRFGR